MKRIKLGIVEVKKVRLFLKPKKEKINIYVKGDWVGTIFETGEIHLSSRFLTEPKKFSEKLFAMECKEE